jgi:hypothetical protein
MLLKCPRKTGTNELLDTGFRKKKREREGERNKVSPMHLASLQNNNYLNHVPDIINLSISFPNPIRSVTVIII